MFKGKFLYRDIDHILNCKVMQCILVRIRGETFHLFDELGDIGWS